MKHLAIFGALSGLLIGAGLGLHEGASWPTVLWRGCLLSICTGYLTRWWGGVWIRCLRDAQAERSSLPQQFPINQPKS